jgi:hypothetical protein
VWHARIGIVARGCAGAVSPVRQAEPGCRYVAAAGGAAGPAVAAGRVYPLACLVQSLCAFTAAGNDRLTAVGQWIRRASQETGPGRAPWDDRLPVPGADEKTIRVP